MTGLGPIITTRFVNWLGRCHLCGSRDAEPWNEDHRFAECADCHHVCNHTPSKVLGDLLTLTEES